MEAGGTAKKLDSYRCLKRLDFDGDRKCGLASLFACHNIAGWQ
jgi:hypothetical protein